MSKLREILKQNARIESLFVRRPVLPEEFFEIYLAESCKPLPLQTQELIGLELRFEMQTFIDQIGVRSHMRELMINEFIAQFKQAVFGDAIQRIQNAKSKLRHFVEVEGLDCFRELELALEAIENV